MKPTVAPHETRVICLRIECTTGLIIRVTRYPRDLTMSNGHVYLTGSGFDFTGYSASSSLSPAAIDMQGFLGFAGVTDEVVGSGIFDNARCYLFACNYLAPIEDHEPIVCSILGKTTFEDDKYTIEEMALIDALNQSIGKTYSPACQKPFGGQEFAGCKIALAPITVSGTLTAVTHNASFRDASRSEAADWFGGGRIAFTSGLNAGLPAVEIKHHLADGTLVTHEPFYHLPQVGDAYTLTPGCRHRLVDCRDKWNNVINFGGFSHMPPGSAYSSMGSR